MRALLTAAFLLTTLLFSGHEATAAPPTAADPPGILTPADPPEPQPCRKVGPVPCDVTFPTLTVDVPTTPSEPSEPAGEPSTTAVTTPAEEASSTPASGDGTSTGDGTAAGSARTASPVSPPGPAGTDWWLITIPVLALLALAAAGTVLLIQRSERPPR
ncbi:hypothetical protein [Actinophytocola sp.]|uniref:hypothetical protein n=1 Tax=Actinophytocola sp. TaxID=1872138 RepID=UPI002D74D6A8|nr:hypothetical protein [Actinophytocola sp.]HYQ64973.1 hypothetical protein [Actinophytocola sp.]